MREQAVTQKVQTPFRSMYVCLTHDDVGRITGGKIFDPRKEPDSTVAELVDALSDGLDQAIKAVVEGLIRDDG